MISSQEKKIIKNRVGLLIEVHNLPPYCPELNAAEALWKVTRKSGTHNKHFETEEKLISTLDAVLGNMYENPSEVSGYMTPFL